ncbi:hypothetical protein PsorP6_011682 [Peronosclerospora sorghi]|uniref:Uncharacterized protein n=1 Tax=Peronosclerospora sorghi TaxID=230839 RepID=A0ACC0WJ86_9STRA|nr:hypothetical protein PsorP6_011682 [Peronosclerospora sorghi]
MSCGYRLLATLVDASTQIKEKSEMEYEAHIQGDIVEIRRAKVPEGSQPDSVEFLQGDAYNLSSSLVSRSFSLQFVMPITGPKNFLTQISERINPGGLFVLLEEYTRKDKWIRGVSDAEGNHVDRFSQIEKLISKDFELIIERQDFPFLIHQHVRKYQWGVSDRIYWKNLSNHQLQMSHR